MAATKDDASLLELLDLSQLNCLNESSQYPFKSIVSAKAVNSSSNYLLIFALSRPDASAHPAQFNQFVRVRSIVIKSSGGAQAPKKVKLLVNRPSIGFEDVEDAEEPEVAQILDISEDDVKEGRPIPLRFVRFQSLTRRNLSQTETVGEDYVSF
ncbi:galactose-binding domain-like protein [Mycena latifolia]|nr:galactose-binding domain-like protein [Mycena latifolia]